MNGKVQICQKWTKAECISSTRLWRRLRVCGMRWPRPVCPESWKGFCLPMSLLGKRLTFCQQWLEEKFLSDSVGYLVSSTGWGVCIWNLVLRWFRLSLGSVELVCTTVRGCASVQCAHRINLGSVICGSITRWRSVPLLQWTKKGQNAWSTYC